MRVLVVLRVPLVSLLLSCCLPDDTDALIPPSLGRSISAAWHVFVQSSPLGCCRGLRLPIFGLIAVSVSHAVSLLAALTCWPLFSICLWLPPVVSRAAGALPQALPFKVVRHICQSTLGPSAGNVTLP